MGRISGKAGRGRLVAANGIDGSPAETYDIPMAVVPAVPAVHTAFLEGALARLAADARLLGVAAGGSYAAGTLDEFSDLDLVIAVEPSAYEAVLVERQTIAAGLGTLLVACTGEHVGEPRLLICLYRLRAPAGVDGPALLHVDLKFVSLPDAARRVEDPVVLWERDGRLRAVLGTGIARYPEPDLQGIEDRFWVLVHYVAAKVGRGELLEAADALGFVRYLALGPLALLSRGARPTGVRKLEHVAPDLAVRIGRTVAVCDTDACLAALQEAIAVYRDLRSELAPVDVRRHTEAEDAAVAYVHAIASRRKGS